MKCKIRKWELSDAGNLAAALSNKKYKIIFGMDYLILIQSRMGQILYLICFLQMKMKHLLLLLL